MTTATTPILNKEQQQFRTRVLASLNTQGKARLLLTGEAGTGKTFTLASILTEIADDYSVQCLYPTHQAKNVARCMLPADTTIATTTMHSFLRRSGFVTELGEVAFRRGSVPESAPDLIIIDECFMVDRRMIDLVLLLPSTIIFVGDPKQLLPVRAKCKPLQDICEHHQLVQQMRNTSAIEAIANTQRNFPYAFFPKSAITTQHQLVERFMAQSADDIANSVYLTYTNERADYVAHKVRDRLFGVGSAPYVVGERLQARFNKVHVKTNEVFTVQSVEVEPANTECAFDVYRLGIGHGEYIRTLEPAAMRSFMEYVQEVREQARQAKAMGNADLFAELAEEARSMSTRYEQVAYPYAMTIHKAQGSTFKHVFVDTVDVRERGTSKPRLLYVAYSRARTNLYTVNIEIDNKDKVYVAYRAAGRVFGRRIRKPRNYHEMSAEQVRMHLEQYGDTSVAEVKVFIDAMVLS